MKTIETSVLALLDEFAQQDIESAHLRESLFVTGNPSYCLAKAAINYDLLVVSSHGRSGFSRFILGSVTDKLIRLAPVPILVVEEKSALLPMDRILVLTDLSLNSEAALPYARDIAQVTGAMVDLLYVHVCDSAQTDATEAFDNRMQAFVEQYFADVSVKTSVLQAENSSHQGIYRFLQENKCNLIVMAAAGKSRIEQLLLGSTTAQVACDANTNLFLVAPEYQRELRLENIENYFKV